MSDTTARVWIGCLGCYSGGRLVGDWFDATDAPTEMGEFNAEIHWEPGGAEVYHLGDEHEELWVMDHEGFGGLLTGECSPSTAKRIGELIDGLAGDNVPVAAFAAWLANNGTDVESVEWDGPTEQAFKDAYHGQWDSEKDYAQDFAEETSPSEFRESDLWSYIDWDRYADEFFMGGYWSTSAPDGGVYVFQST